MQKGTVLLKSRQDWFCCEKKESPAGTGIGKHSCPVGFKQQPWSVASGDKLIDAFLIKR